MKECVDNLSQEVDKEKLVSSLWGAERCLRVLESVSVVGIGKISSVAATAGLPQAEISCFEAQQSGGGSTQHGLNLEVWF